MQPTEDAPRPPFWRPFLAGVMLCLVALAATWAVRTWQVTRVEQGVQQEQEEALAEALDDTDRAFRQMQQALLDQGHALANDPEVVDALHERMFGEARAGEARIVHHFADLSLPDRWAVEVYSPELQLLAWQGFSMPPDAAPEAARFLETFQTAIAEDDDWRQALAVWVPVRDGVRALGVIRLLRMVYARTPVQNQYLNDYSLAEDWERRIQLPIEFDLQRPFVDEAPARGQARLLQGLDGTVLGRVTVRPPDSEQLIVQVRARYGDVLTFWTTLLLFWIVAGLWVWYRSHAGVGRLLSVLAAWTGLRYALLAMNVPARWQPGKAPLSPLFDPTHLASTFGGGLMRSAGDFFISTLFVLVAAFTVLHYARRFTTDRSTVLEEAARNGSPMGRLRLMIGFVVGAGIVFALTVLLAIVAHHAILDSTLDFFSREDLFPKPLVLIIYCTLLIGTLSVLILGVAVAWMSLRRAWLYGVAFGSKGVMLGCALLLTVGFYGLFYYLFDLAELVPWTIALAFLCIVFSLAVLGHATPQGGVAWLTLRSVLPTLFLLGILLYPLIHNGLDAQQESRMIDAAESFDLGRDPAVLFAIEQVLTDALAEPEVATLLADTSRDARRRDALDSLATVLLRGSLLASQSAYDASIFLIDAAGVPAGRYEATEPALGRDALDAAAAETFRFLKLMYAEKGGSGPMIEMLTGRRESDRFQYVGMVPVGEPPVGWVVAHAEPRSLLQEGRTPFLRVLLPAGYGNLYASLSLAEFRNGMLVRSFGRDFGRYRLDPEVRRQLVTAPTLWRSEKVGEKERRFLTYYRRTPIRQSPSLVLTQVDQAVVAVRVPHITTFDHLYYLLRLTVAGLFIGLPFYLLGLYLRWRAGLLPAPRVRFRDKVLNAFLVVGILAVSAVGFLGVQVVTEENERAIQDWLRRHLEQVEETLRLEAESDEMPYQVIERMRVDSLAARVGFDLNLYQGATLIRSSRQQLLRERLIDRRLPVDAFEALYLEGFQMTFVEEQLGNFHYTAGYRALLDEQGQPAYVVSVPTLPEQERIEEERARTLAYLFGALLLLLVVVMATASLLANALARPIGRLRVGLQDVAQGRFERKLPVDTRDEIGELVETFNEMQEQLAESRRKLAQQERQLAWREMARQVAHEIKNPLTPMKLSVQHLRRAFDDVATTNGADAEAEDLRAGKFASMFERVTGTLVEQIDTLARIANEFSSFARMPTRVVERLDLNAVIEEAVALMQAEAEAEIHVDLAPEPLIVEADHEELRRVFINLIKNALQALPEDGAGQVRVATQAEPEDNAPGTAYSTVTDTGTGIPADLRDKIFEPNFSTKTSGTGLGLAITRKTIEELGGEIGFETEEAVGTTFWIRLPRAD